MEDEQVKVVCEFLKKREVKQDVIDRFREHKMDYQAVVMSTAEDLERLGCLKGDAMNLKFFAQSQIEREKNGSIQEKKQLLEKILTEGSQARKRKSTRDQLKACVPVQSNQTRKVTVGWLNYDESTRSYKQVKTVKGGGVCVVDLPLTSTPEEIVAIGRNLFFQNESSTFGDAKDMEFGLANFQRGQIEDNNFTLQKYIDQYKRKLIKLFITSRKKRSEVVSLSDGSESESDLPNQTAMEIEKNDDKVSDSSDFEFELPVWDAMDIMKPEEKALEDRRKVIAQQDVEFQKSLEADKEKRLKLAEEEEKVQKQFLLMIARQARVPEEPGPGEDSVVVRVRHITLGLIERHFRPYTLMSEVYDWVGSLSLIPENFTLSDFSKDLPPNDSIPNTASVLNMKESFTTPSLDHYEVPSQLMEDDPSDEEAPTPTTSTNCMPTLLQNHEQEETSTPDERQAEDSSHLESPIKESMAKRVIKIRRCVIMADMIQHFKDKTILSCHIIVVMVNSFAEEENGVDNNGVFLDALSAFWSEFYDSCTAGEEGRVPVIRHDFQWKEWEAVAHILVKGYHQVNFFPIKLSQAFVVASILGENKVTSDLLLASFLQYVSKDERELIEASFCNKLNEEQSEEWLDFLDRFQCKTIPKPEQVKSVVEEIAHKELIQCPRYITDCWMQPCRMLRTDFSTAADVNRLYEKVRPSNKKILALLTANPINNAERDAFSYLQRYVRGISEEKLQKFLRYCTGSTMICVPHITVMFTNLDGCARRPVAHTCGSVLEMPTTYASFPQFREEMNNILTGEYWDIDFL